MTKVDPVYLWQRSVTVEVPGRAPEEWPDSRKPFHGTAGQCGINATDILPRPQFTFVGRQNPKSEKTRVVLLFRASATLWRVTYEVLISEVTTKGGSRIPLTDRPPK